MGKETTNNNLSKLYQEKLSKGASKELEIASKSDMSRNASIIPASALMSMYKGEGKRVAKESLKSSVSYPTGVLDWSKGTGQGMDLFSRRAEIVAPSFSFGNSLLTDGIDDFVTIGEVTEFISASSCTISYWMDVATAQVCPMGKSAINNARFEVLKFSDNNLYFVINSGTTGNFGSVSYVPYLGTQAHIVAIFDGSLTGNVNRAKVYINGVQQSLTFSGTIPSTTSAEATWELNRNSSFGIGLGAAQYNEVAIFQSALTSADVAELYNSGNGFNANELTSGNIPLIYYRCNENDGETTLVDTNGNYNGTLNNFSTPPAYFVTW